MGSASLDTGPAFISNNCVFNNRTYSGEIKRPRDPAEVNESLSFECHFIILQIDPRVPPANVFSRISISK